MTALFTREQLRAFAPAAKAEIIDALLEGQEEIAGARITTPLRLQHFFAQIAVETGGLRLLEENLNYSAERLLVVFKKYYKTPAQARAHARQPQKIANRVYGGRLGNKKPNDGWDFRGGSMIQTTGRDNYRAAGHEDDPETLRQPGPALTAALKFWTDNNLNAYADRDDLTGLRKRVNGGTHGLADARNYLAKAKRVLKGVEGADALPEDLPAGKIKALQNQLLALGYKPGKADGRIGSITIGAIAAFQAENGLEVTGRFDADTQAHLYEAEPRIVVRTDDKPEDSRILKQAGAVKKGAAGLMAAAGFDAAADPLSQLEAAKAMYDRVQGVLAPFQAAGDFLSQHWLLVAGALGLIAFLYMQKIQKARLEDHLSGASA